MRVASRNSLLDCCAAARSYGVRPGIRSRRNAGTPLRLLRSDDVAVQPATVVRDIQDARARPNPEHDEREQKGDDWRAKKKPGTVKSRAHSTYCRSWKAAAVCQLSPVNLS